MTQRFETRPLSPALGIEIAGVDLARLTAEEGEALVALLADELLLVVRGQELSTEDQIALMRRFGDVADELGTGVPSYYISNVRPDGTLGESPLPLHSDWTWTTVPVFVASLYAEEVTGPATPTRFSNAARAYETLPHELKRRIDGLRTLHLHEPRSMAERGPTRHQLDKLPDDVAKHVPRMTQPAVLRHPCSGVPLLFVNALWVSHILDLTDEESEALLSELFAHLAAPENLCEHVWQQGDCVIWDNLAVQHGRPGFEGLGARRTLRRVSTSEGGASPMLAAGLVIGPGIASRP